MVTLQSKQNKQTVNSLYGRTKAVACLHMSLLFGQCWILQSEKYRLWINVIGSVQEEICP